MQHHPSAPSSRQRWTQTRYASTPSTAASTSGSASLSCLNCVRMTYMASCRAATRRLQCRTGHKGSACSSNSSSLDVRQHQTACRAASTWLVWQAAGQQCTHCSALESMSRQHMQLEPSAACSSCARTLCFIRCRLAVRNMQRHAARQVRTLKWFAVQLAA